MRKSKQSICYRQTFIWEQYLSDTPYPS